MKYMMLIAGREEEWAGTDDAAAETYRRVAEWWNGHEAAGRIVEGHQLEPSATATAAVDGRDRCAVLTSSL